MLNPAYEQYQQQSDEFSLNPILHFVASPASVVSPSGLAIQLFGPQTHSLSHTYAVASAPTSCWEVIAPVNCDGIRLGVIQKGFKLNSIASFKEKHCLDFRASSIRTINFQIVDSKLLVYMNGNLNEKKTVDLKKQATWFPYVEIKNQNNQGNHLILNPFPFHPAKGPYQMYHLVAPHLHFPKVQATLPAQYHSNVVPVQPPHEDYRRIAIGQ